MKNSKKETMSHESLLLVTSKKLTFFKDIIQKTFIHVQKNKCLDILGISDVANCIEQLEQINKKIKTLTDTMQTNYTSDDIINKLQIINNDLSALFKVYGTDSLEDLLLVCLGNSHNTETNAENTDKYDILKKYENLYFYVFTFELSSNENSFLYTLHSDKFILL